MGEEDVVGRCAPWLLREGGAGGTVSNIGSLPRTSYRRLAQIRTAEMYEPSNRVPHACPFIITGVS